VSVGIKTVYGLNRCLSGMSFVAQKKFDRKRAGQKTKDRDAIILHLLVVHVACPPLKKRKRGIAINEPGLY